MDRLRLLEVLRQWDRQGRYVFARRDLVKLFREDAPKTLSQALDRHVKAGLLVRPCRSVYVYPDARSLDGLTLERIASIVRAGHYCYVSLESALSEYGVISQMPIDRLTLMTTGRRGVYHTPYGTLEFTHTKRSVTNILDHTVKRPDHHLRVATKFAAWRDLKRVGRNTGLVDQSRFGWGE